MPTSLYLSLWLGKKSSLYSLLIIMFRALKFGSESWFSQQYFLFKQHKSSLLEAKSGYKYKVLRIEDEIKDENQIWYDDMSQYGD